MHMMELLSVPSWPLQTLTRRPASPSPLSASLHRLTWPLSAVIASLSWCGLPKPSLGQTTSLRLPITTSLSGHSQPSLQKASFYKNNCKADWKEFTAETATKFCLGSSSYLLLSREKSSLWCSTMSEDTLLTYQELLPLSPWCSLTPHHRKTERPALPWVTTFLTLPFSCWGVTDSDQCRNLLELPPTWSLLVPHAEAEEQEVEFTSKHLKHLQWKNPLQSKGDCKSLGTGSSLALFIQQDRILRRLMREVYNHQWTSTSSHSMKEVSKQPLRRRAPPLPRSLTELPCYTTTWYRMDYS